MKSKAGSHLYITPVSGVHLGEGSNGEYRIDKVTLFSPERFLKTRRYTFIYKEWRKRAAESAALKSSAVVAVVSVGGEPDVARRYAHGLVKEELGILASSRLGRAGRDRRAIIGIQGCMDTYDTEELLLGHTVDLVQLSSKTHVIDDLRITDEFLKMPHFSRLLWLIRGNGSIDDKWRRILRDVAMLAGRSQSSVEIADAFLWNMISLEQLLLGKNESGHLQKILSRCEALFGYCLLWDRMELEEAITQIYHARCALVHEGDRESITLGNLVAADIILSNVIRGVVLNSSLINSKGALFDMAEKAKARHLLGMDAREKGWRWSFSHLNYTEKRLKEFWVL